MGYAQRRFRPMAGLKGLKDRHWQQGVPPVEHREKLWKLRNYLRFQRHHGPYKSPWLPKVLAPKMRREIQLERDPDDCY